MRPPLRTDDPDADAPDTSAPSPASSTAAAGDPPANLLEILDPIPTVEPVENPFGLSARELLFVAAYCGVAEGSAAKAYELAGYKTTGGASRANASRMLTRPRIQAAVNEKLAKRLRIMGGDEALEGITRLARSDIRLVFPEGSWVRKLPAEVAECIKSIRPGKHGYTIELYPKDHALELMAKVSGRLKETLKVEHTLEDILARANRQEGDAA